jgi:hypothetical protein
MASYEQYSSQFSRELEINLDQEQISDCDYFFEYIKFFKKEKKKKYPPRNLQTSNFPCLSIANLFQFVSFFEAKEKQDYQFWIKIQVMSLISSEFLKNEMLFTCLSLFESNLVLCEMVFPYLIRTILLQNPDTGKIIGNNFKQIFDVDFNTKFKDDLKIVDLKCFLKLFIGTVDFLRIYSKKIK